MSTECDLSNFDQSFVDKTFYNSDVFPYLFMKKNCDPISEENLHFDDSYLEVLRSQTVKLNINVTIFADTLSSIYEKKDYLYQVRSILLLFAFKNMIDIFPFFTELITEDKLFKAQFDEDDDDNEFSHFLGTKSRFFTKAFYNELSKHRILMLNVVESIHHFVEACSLNYDQIYPIINNIILANEYSATPITSHELNFMEPDHVINYKYNYKEQIMRNFPVILPFSIKYDDYLKEDKPEMSISFKVKRDDILPTVWEFGAIRDTDVSFEIHFFDEEGIDAGGLRKEFIDLSIKEIFKTETDLFDLRGNQYWFKYHNWKDLKEKEDLLNKYYCIGILIGIVILNKMQIPIHFPRYFYKKLLRRDIYQTDLVYFDKDLFQSIMYLFTNTITEDDGIPYIYSDSLGRYEIDLDTFTEVSEDFEPPCITEENKADYAYKIADWVFNVSIKEEFEAFEKGFRKVRPSPMLYHCFRLDEIDQIISGPYTCDWEKLKRGVVYDGYEPDSQNIIWFWQYFDELDEEGKFQVLKFITGGTSVPPGELNGYIEIEYVYRSGLPNAHVCFNRLDLPEYESYEKLINSCELAFNNANCFGFD